MNLTAVSRTNDSNFGEINFATNGNAAKRATRSIRGAVRSRSDILVCNLYGHTCGDVNINSAKSEYLHLVERDSLAVQL